MSHELEWNEKESGCKLFGLVILCLFVPPATVYIRRGPSTPFYISLAIFLTMWTLNLFVRIPILNLLCAPFALGNLIYSLICVFQPIRKPAPSAQQMGGYGGAPPMFVVQTPPPAMQYGQPQYMQPQYPQAQYVQPQYMPPQHGHSSPAQ